MTFIERQSMFRAKAAKIKYFKTSNDIFMYLWSEKISMTAKYNENKIHVCIANEYD